MNLADRTKHHQGKQFFALLESVNAGPQPIRIGMIPRNSFVYAAFISRDAPVLFAKSNLKNLYSIGVGGDAQGIAKCVSFGSKRMVRLQMGDQAGFSLQDRDIFLHYHYAFQGEPQSGMISVCVQYCAS